MHTNAFCRLAAKWIRIIMVSRSVLRDYQLYNKDIFLFLWHIGQWSLSNKNSNNGKINLIRDTIIVRLLIYYSGSNLTQLNHFCYTSIFYLWCEQNMVNSTIAKISFNENSRLLKIPETLIPVWPTLKEFAHLLNFQNISALEQSITFLLLAL